MSIYTKNLPHTPYFYIIEHIATGMRYAGCRFSKAKTIFSDNGCHPIELLKAGGYTTSSKIVKAIIESEGIDSFKIILILKESELTESVLMYETNFLQTNVIANDEHWYNMHNNDNKWFDAEYVKSVMLE